MVKTEEEKAAGKARYLARMARGKQGKRTRNSDRQESASRLLDAVCGVSAFADFKPNHADRAVSLNSFPTPRDPKTPYVPKFITEKTDDGVVIGRVRNPAYGG